MAIKVYYHSYFWPPFVNIFSKRQEMENEKPNFERKKIVSEPGNREGAQFSGRSPRVSGVKCNCIIRIRGRKERHVIGSDISTKKISEPCNFRVEGPAN